MSLPELLCYPGDLNQVWTNIIDNAIQAMDGHGTLTLRTKRENEDMIRVEIGDDGPGIPDDIVGNIFNPFFTTKPYGGALGWGWIWPTRSWSSATAICGWCPSPATPGSSSCCRCRRQPQSCPQNCRHRRSFRPDWNRCNRGRG